MALRFMILPVLAASLAFVTNSGPAHAQSCPSQMLDPIEIEQAINASSSCSSAFRILEACQRGSSGDVRIARKVVAKCEAQFSAELTSAQRSQYLSEKQACVRKHAGKQGVEFQSFSGFCEAELALKYSRR